MKYFLKYIIIILLIFTLSCDDGSSNFNSKNLIGYWNLISVKIQGVDGNNLIPTKLKFDSENFTFETEEKLTTGTFQLVYQNLVFTYSDGIKSSVKIKKLNNDELIYTSSPDIGSGDSKLEIEYSFKKEYSSP